MRAHMKFCRFIKALNMRQIFLPFLIKDNNHFISSKEHLSQLTFIQDKKAEIPHMQMLGLKKFFLTYTKEL